LEVGDEADIAIGPDQEVDLGIAGSHQILTDGEVPDLPDESLVTDIHPRTAVGISRDGSELFVLVLDGRSAESAGMSLPELGQFLADMGATAPSTSMAAAPRPSRPERRAPSRRRSGTAPPTVRCAR